MGTRSTFRINFTLLRYQTGCPSSGVRWVSRGTGLLGILWEYFALYLRDVLHLCRRSRKERGWTHNAKPRFFSIRRVATRKMARLASSLSRTTYPVYHFLQAKKVNSDRIHNCRSTSHVFIQHWWLITGTRARLGVSLGTISFGIIQ